MALDRDREHQVSARTRAMKEADRAALLGAAVAHLRRAHEALRAAGAPVAAERTRRASKAASEAYTLATGRARYEVRCQHGILLSVSCQACAATTAS
jgi:hypothetical protein